MKPRYSANRKDDNHVAIVKELRSRGFAVLELYAGADICVGKFGRNWIFEIKNAQAPAGQRVLTQTEEAFFRGWLGQASVVTSCEQIIDRIRQDIEKDISGLNKKVSPGS